MPSSFPAWVCSLFLRPSISCWKALPVVPVHTPPPPMSCAPRKMPLDRKRAVRCASPVLFRACSAGYGDRQAIPPPAPATRGRRRVAAGAARRAVRLLRQGRADRSEAGTQLQQAAQRLYAKQLGRGEPSVTSDAGTDRACGGGRGGRRHRLRLGAPVHQELQRHGDLGRGGRARPPLGDHQSGRPQLLRHRGDRLPAHRLGSRTSPPDVRPAYCPPGAATRPCSTSAQARQPNAAVDVSARAMFQRIQLDSKCARTAPRSAIRSGLPAAARLLLSGTLKPMVMTSVTTYSTTAAAIHGSTERQPAPRWSTPARAVSSNAPRKLAKNQPLRMATLIRCIPSTKVRSSARRRPSITEQA